MTQAMKLFSSLVRHHRHQMSLSREELAKELGLSIQTIANYEVGRVRPKIEHMVHVANFLGFSLSELQKQVVKPPHETEIIP